MHYNCFMISPRDTLPKEEEGANVDGTEQDGAEREEGATNLTARTEAGPRYV